MALKLERRAVTNAPWSLGAVVVLIAAIGVYNLASASRPPLPPMWQPQLLYFGVGIVAVGILIFLPPRWLRSLVIPLYSINIVALLALKVFGLRAKGALSWYSIGPFRIQPAEFMKITMVLVLAKYFHDVTRSPAQGYELRSLAVPLGLSLLPIGLVLVQPDLGTALMMLFTAATMVLFARPSPRATALIAVLLIIGGGIMWNDYVRDQPEPRFTFVRGYLKPHQDTRISGWLDPTFDVRGTNYHATQSRIAVGSGGPWGKGWRQGTQTGLRFLPEQHTDFIFSVFAEEQGFASCLALLGLYCALFVLSLRVANSARDRFGVFVAVGVTAMLFWQTFENIGMVTGLLPITGITLPLMSYGGSSMVSVMVGIGLLFNIAIRRGEFA